SKRTRGGVARRHAANAREPGHPRGHSQERQSVTSGNDLAVRRWQNMASGSGDRPASASSILGFLFEHALVRKPVSTFRDPALGRSQHNSFVRPQSNDIVALKLHAIEMSRDQDCVLVSRLAEGLRLVCK